MDELPFNIIEGIEEGSFRPDINILINGIPLAFLEVKKPNNEGGIQKEFDCMINKRLQNQDYKKYFNMLQMVSFSNNMEYEDEDDAEEVNCSDKVGFTKELNKSLSTNINDDAIGEICVVNIQKFEGKMSEVKNQYQANVQRMFFVDKTHRSYSSTGEFFKKLNDV